MPSSSSESGRRRGSAPAVFGWAFVWLAGTAAITGYSMTRHAPALERLMLDEVQDAVAPIGDAPVMVSVRDHVATLSGTVDGAERHDALLAAAAGSLGIRHVVDRLVVREAPVPEAPGDEASTREATVAAAPSGAGTVEAVAADETEELPLDEPTDADLPLETPPIGETPENIPSDDPPLAGLASGETSTAELPPDEDETASAPTADGSLAELPPEIVPGEDDPAETMAAESLAELPPEPLPGEDDAASGTTTEESLAELPPEFLPDEDDASERPTTTGTADREPVDEKADTGETEGAESPTLRLEVVDGVLTIDGTLSSEDDSRALVGAAMESFDLDYVSDALESDADVARADWLTPLVALLPALRTLDDPGVAVSERQITLSGTASDASARDRVVEAALGRLGDYSLVERIDVAAIGTAAAEPDSASVEGEADAPEPTDPEIDAVSLASADVEAGSGENGAPESTGSEVGEASPASATADSGDVSATADSEVGELPSPATDVTDVTDGRDDEAVAKSDDPADTNGTGAGTAAGASTAVEVDGEEGTGAAGAVEAAVVEDATDTAVTNAAAADVVDTDDAVDADADADAADADADADATDSTGEDDGVLRTARLESNDAPAAEAPANGAPTLSPAAALRADLEALPGGKILFESGSDTLTATSRARVDGIARVLARHPDVTVAIEGHTDGRGYRAKNLRLSQKRANAVRDRLVSRGVSRDRLIAYGYGEGVPIADNSTPEGRAANRRIELTY